jgi:hypothetical protein
MTGPFPGPTPPYNNPPIEAQYYKPSRFVISAITLGIITTITTTLPMNYVLGQEVRLVIPPTYGTRQLNEQTALVVGIPSSNEVNLNINSINYDPYVASTQTTQAQIMAIGDVNTGHINPFGITFQRTDIPGSFINISPY